jgi:hypothetical protein
MPEPAKARAVFSTEDFRLLKQAVQYFAQNNLDHPDSIKYSSLFHRLGRLKDN